MCVFWSVEAVFCSLSQDPFVKKLLIIQLGGIKEGFSGTYCQLCALVASLLRFDSLSGIRACVQPKQWWKSNGKIQKKHLHSNWRLSFPGFDFELWERVVFICLFVQKLTPAPFFLQFKAVLKLFCPLWGLTHFNYCTCVFMWLTVPKKKKIV